VRNCSYHEPTDALFCMKCGINVENRSSSCSTVNPTDARFCRKCRGARYRSALAVAGPFNIPDCRESFFQNRKPLRYARERFESES